MGKTLAHLINVIAESERTNQAKRANFRENKAKQPIINHTHTHQTDGIRITKNEKLILMRNSMDKYEIGLSLIIRREKETGVEDIFG